MSKFFSDTATLGCIDLSQPGQLHLEFSLAKLETESKRIVFGVDLFEGSNFEDEARDGWGKEWRVIFDDLPGSHYDSDSTWASFELGCWISEVWSPDPPPDLGLGRVSIQAQSDRRIHLIGLDGETTRVFGAHLGQIYIRFVRRARQRRGVEPGRGEPDHE